MQVFVLKLAMIEREDGEGNSILNSVVISHHKTREEAEERRDRQIREDVEYLIRILSDSDSDKSLIEDTEKNLLAIRSNDERVETRVERYTISQEFEVFN